MEAGKAFPDDNFLFEAAMEDGFNTGVGLATSIMAFITNMQSGPGVTLSLTQAVTENLRDVLKDVSAVCKQKVLKMCENLALTSPQDL